MDYIDRQRKVVLTSGQFDLCTPGHITFFNACKALGDKLVVAITSDSCCSVKKGNSGFPIYNQRMRMFMVENIASVDEVVGLDGDTPDAFNKNIVDYIKLRGDVKVVADGADSPAKRWALPASLDLGFEYVSIHREYMLPEGDELVPVRTTSIINRIRNLKIE